MSLATADALMGIFGMKRVKSRKCVLKDCRKPFQPRSMTHKTCSQPCAEMYVKLERAKAILKDQRKQAKVALEDRRQHKGRLEASKRPQDLKAQVQKLVNKCARLRDALDGCISCDKLATWDGQWHGSHYKAAGANSALRFNLWNIHKACSVCNNYKSGNIAEYKPRLIEKVGQARVDWLDTHERSRKYSTEWLKKAKRVFGKLAKRYERRLKELKGREG